MTTTTADPTTDLRIALPAGVPADRLLAAVLDVEGWWSTVVDRDGDEFVAHFGVNWTRMRVDAGPDRVTWTCVAQDTPGIPVGDEWVGDVLTFAIAPTGDGSSVLTFTHGGLLAQECVDICRPEWRRCVARVVELAETGATTPYVPAA